MTADEIFLASEYYSLGCFLYCDHSGNMLSITFLIFCSLCRVKEFRRFSEKSDVYSFGVFLLELVSGREASSSPSPDSSQDLVELVCDQLSFRS